MLKQQKTYASNTYEITMANTDDLQMTSSSSKAVISTWYLAWFLGELVQKTAESCVAPAKRLLNDYM